MGSPFFQFFGGKLPSIDWKLDIFFDDYFFTIFFCREIFQKLIKLKHVVFGFHFFTSKKLFEKSRFSSDVTEFKKYQDEQISKKNSRNLSLTTYRTMLLFLGNS